MRINVVPVESLSDAHLRAEYREIMMMPSYYKRSLESKEGIVDKDIPTKYTLNEGHAKFFYRKYGYVVRRLMQLEEEMKKRGFKTREESDLQVSQVEVRRRAEYFPTAEDYILNIERILERIKEKYDEGDETFYKYYGENQTYKQWEERYQDVLDKKYNSKDEERK